MYQATFSHHAYYLRAVDVMRGAADFRDRRQWDHSQELGGGVLYDSSLSVINRSSLLCSGSVNMRARSAITLSVPRIHLLLRFMLGVLLVSLSITTSLLSITVFLLRERFSQPWRNLRDSIASDEDSFSCKLHVSNLQRPEEFTVRNLTSKSLIIIRSVLLLQHRRLNFPESTAALHQIDLKQTLCPVVRHIESDNCPWDWAPGCAWSSFIATARLDFVPNRILATENDFKLTVSKKWDEFWAIMIRKDTAKSRIRYVDWLQVIEFIEIWTSQGVNHFFFYFYTVSQLVMDILQYYEAKGTVTLLPWRSFPVGENENPNRDVYRLAHSLANNDCLWRSYGAHFVAFVDLDEYILTANGMPLINFIKRKAELCPKCGSFAVMHSKMYYSSPRPQNDFHWRDIRFEWLTNISYGLPEANGPHKQIVRPETVSVISTHSTRRNFPGYIDVS
ncbi:unnamed protein product, partial [Acanthocheilonema viteae]